MGISKRYDTAKEWTRGFVDGIRPCLVDASNATDHYTAGYDAGYSLRNAKNELLNKYIASIGLEPFGVVHTAEAAGKEKR